MNLCSLSVPRLTYVLLGCILWHPRQNSYHRGSARQPRSYNRRFYSTAPPKAARRDKGSHQSSPLLHTRRIICQIDVIGSQNVQNDTGRLATSVAKERELSTRLVAELSTDISTFKNTPLQVTAKTDPCAQCGLSFLGCHAHPLQIRSQSCRHSSAP